MQSCLLCNRKGIASNYTFIIIVDTGPCVCSDWPKKTCFIRVKKTVLRKYTHWLVKYDVSLTWWRNRPSRSCWCNDGVSKENLNFDNQIKVNKLFSLFVSRCFLKEIGNMVSLFLLSYRNTDKVWENSKKLLKPSPAISVSSAFLVLPKLPLMFLLNNIRLWACDFYHVIVDKGEAPVNYQA